MFGSLSNLFAMTRERFDRYRDTRAARVWLTEGTNRLRRLFEDKSVSDFVFEPFARVFSFGEFTEDRVKLIITQVAVANAVMAGLPGRMGIGVGVSVALEAWMAFAIARQVGVSINSPTDALRYFGLLTGIAVTILEGFRQLLGFGFSLFSVIPGVNPLIPAELFVTNLVGVLFWIGFEEARESGSFGVPTRLLRTANHKARALLRHQLAILTGALSIENIRQVGRRLSAWLRGDIPTDNPALRGELLTTVAVAALLARRAEALEGPLGNLFAAAVRRAYSKELGDATFEEMAEHFSRYKAAELAGAENLIKGHLFEQLVVQFENADGDEWRAELHDAPNFPGSDMVITNDETGETIAVSIKAAISPDLIESALIRYPDIPIETTVEGAEGFESNPMVSSSGVSGEYVTVVTRENIDRALDSLDNLSLALQAGRASATAAILALWPFVVAYLRKRISADQLDRAFTRVFGDAGVTLASRVAYGVVFGPLFAWYLLARGVIAMTEGLEAMARQGRERRHSSTIRLLTYRGPQSER